MTVPTVSSEGATMGHSGVALASWQRFLNLIDIHNPNAIAIDGHSLDLASITALARHEKKANLSDKCLKQVQRSAGNIKAQLDAGATIYAVNTGVGASANTRTDAVGDLQQAIIRTLNCGITDEFRLNDDKNDDAKYQKMAQRTLPVQDAIPIDSMPITWVRAAHLVRLNSLACGNSGIRDELLLRLTSLLQANIVPNMPLRGSISASGDLSPLSYLAGALQGNPGIQVWIKKGGKRHLVTADEALKEVGIAPITYAPKEALAIVNGTSVSAAVAALAMHDIHGCMVLAQVLTAMNVEGLNGTIESFDQYFSAVRPHPGQKEAAQNIRYFLRNSRLARKAGTENIDGLLQDRYALRTSPQWLGPELENVLLAHQQVVIECNSVTDNPLVTKDGTVLQGGNFQASAVTSAMDKVRSALQTTGRMLFQQCSELMNPTMNNGLPPNLTVDDPTCDFIFKGMDVASASYQSELALISHGMTPFVMSAELGNQSLNSMALVSARYTHSALSIFMHLAANCLLAICQALDLRAIQHHFEEVMKPKFDESLRSSLHKIGEDPVTSRSVFAKLWQEWQHEMSQRTTLSLTQQVRASVNAAICTTTQDLEIGGTCKPDILYANLIEWSKSIEVEAISLKQKVVQQHSLEKTLPLLGVASKKLYSFVRQDLDIPFLRKGSPAPQNIPTFDGTKIGTTIGTFTSRIYRALRDSQLFVPVMECLEEAQECEQHEKSEQQNQILQHTKRLLPEADVEHEYHEYIKRKRVSVSS